MIFPKGETIPPLDKGKYPYPQQRTSPNFLCCYTLK